jgi:hypothetical protein
MLLWKDTFQTAEECQAKEQGQLEDRPWSNWPRPPGGFLDFGYVVYLHAQSFVIEIRYMDKDVGTVF